MSNDDQKIIAAGIVVAALLLLWFLWMAIRAIRHRRPHGKNVTRAATKVLDVDSGARPDKVELTEHVAWFSGCDPKWAEAEPALGKRGYLALTQTHLVFVP